MVTAIIATAAGVIMFVIGYIFGAKQGVQMEREKWEQQSNIQKV